MQWLNLQYNGFNGSVPGFDKCTALRTLQLNVNKLRGKIPSFDNCTALQKLWLDSNQLSGEIPSFDRCIGLRDLALQNNQLEGAIPKGFAQLTQLSMLALHANPQLQLPPKAPLDADGDPFYENNGAVRGFLACL